MAKELFIIRHGETDFNRQGIVQGSGVDTSLNSLGKLQAKMFFNQYRNVEFSHVYVSALRRTHESVTDFIHLLKIPHSILPELNEIRWGIYEGQKPTPEWKKHYFEVINAWNAGQLHLRIPGGENPIELRKRQERALLFIRKTKSDRVLICMHGRALKSFLCLLTGLPAPEMDRFPHNNLGLYQLIENGNRYQIVKQNCLEHLSELSNVEE